MPAKAAATKPKAAPKLQPAPAPRPKQLPQPAPKGASAATAAGVAAAAAKAAAPDAKQQPSKPTPAAPPTVAPALTRTDILRRALSQALPADAFPPDILRVVLSYLQRVLLQDWSRGTVWDVFGGYALNELAVPESVLRGRRTESGHELYGAWEYDDDTYDDTVSGPIYWHAPWLTTRREIPQEKHRDTSTRESVYDHDLRSAFVDLSRDRHLVAVALPDYGTIDLWSTGHVHTTAADGSARYYPPFTLVRSIPKRVGDERINNAYDEYWDDQEISPMPKADTQHPVLCHYTPSDWLIYDSRVYDNPTRFSKEVGEMQLIVCRWSDGAPLARLPNPPRQISYRPLTFTCVTVCVFGGTIPRYHGYDGDVCNPQLLRAVLEGLGHDLSAIDPFAYGLDGQLRLSHHATASRSSHVFIGDDDKLHRIDADGGNERVAGPPSHIRMDGARADRRAAVAGERNRPRPTLPCWPDMVLTFAGYLLMGWALTGPDQFRRIFEVTLPRMAQVSSVTQIPNSAYVLCGDIPRLLTISPPGGYRMLDQATRALDTMRPLMEAVVANPGSVTAERKMAIERAYRIANAAVDRYFHNRNSHVVGGDVDDGTLAQCAQDHRQWRRTQQQHAAPPGVDMDAGLSHGWWQPEFEWQITAAPMCSTTSRWIDARVVGGGPAAPAAAATAPRGLAAERKSVPAVAAAAGSGAGAKGIQPTKLPAAVAPTTTMPSDAMPTGHIVALEWVSDDDARAGHGQRGGSDKQPKNPHKTGWYDIPPSYGAQLAVYGPENAFREPLRRRVSGNPWAVYVGQLDPNVYGRERALCEANWYSGVPHPRPTGLHATAQAEEHAVLDRCPSTPYTLDVITWHDDDDAHSAGRDADAKVGVGVVAAAAAAASCSGDGSSLLVSVRAVLHPRDSGAWALGGGIPARPLASLQRRQGRRIAAALHHFALKAPAQDGSWPEQAIRVRQIHPPPDAFARTVVCMRTGAVIGSSSERLTSLKGPGQWVAVDETAS